MDTPNAERAKPVRIVSLNVHCWLDRKENEDGARISDFIASHEPTILALQEVVLTNYMGPKSERYLPDLAERLKMEYGFQAARGLHFGNVLLWNPSIVKDVHTHGGFLSDGNSWRRTFFHLSGSVADVPISVCVTHLDHKHEDNRVAQMRKITREFGSTPPLVILGDFNALYKPDYTPSHLAAISKTRREHVIEAPTFELLDGITQHYQVFPAQFKPTCPYKTRVDYLLVHRAGLAASQWEVSRSEITDIVVSDHAALLLELRKKHL